MSQYQHISMQSEQLSKMKISAVAASPRGASCTEYLQRPLSFAWALAFPSHTVLKAFVSHPSQWQPHITDQCNLFIDFWIPNSSKESHRSTTCWRNMAGKHVNTDVSWQLLMAATQKISQSALLPSRTILFLNMKFLTIPLQKEKNEKTHLDNRR